MSVFSTVYFYKKHNFIMCVEAFSTAALIVETEIKQTNSVN